MAQRQYADAQYRIHYLYIAVWQRECTGHDANAKRADCGWHDEIMLNYALAQREHAKDDREDQTDFMHDRIDQYTASGCQKSQENGRRQAMDKTQSGKAQTQAVPVPFLKACDQHAFHMA
jgi:hypothetical protein